MPYGDSCVFSKSILVGNRTISCYGDTGWHDQLTSCGVMPLRTYHPSKVWLTGAQDVLVTSKPYLSMMKYGL